MLLTWGRSQHHGHPDSTDIPTPRPLSTGRQIRQIACGELHTLALTADGRVLTFGSGLMGALGTGELTAAATPVEISALMQPIIEIAAGRHHLLVRARRHASHVSRRSAEAAPDRRRWHRQDQDVGRAQDQARTLPKTKHEPCPFRIRASGRHQRRRPNLKTTRRQGSRQRPNLRPRQDNTM